MNLTPVIGLEIHIQLKTKSKMFCRCDNSGEDKPANTTICPICLGHPGVLPVANKQAIEWTIMTGLALNCEIPQTWRFERKNYFYPDLPKGYQITSSTNPPCRGGFLAIVSDGKKRQIRLNHIHLEEDAAKNFHSVDGQYTLVDYNRASTPLMEIVTEADLRSPQEAKTFLQALRLLARYLGISEADMEKGHLRCDANISLTDQIDASGEVLKFYPKTEIKNLNSFRSVERALTYEIKRQNQLWQEGQKSTQATRGWDENKGVTEEQRAKEEAHDYRYFPEPDLPPINLGKEDSGIDLEKIKQSMPELPQAKHLRFMAEFGLTAENAKVLTDDKGLASFFEETISELRAWLIALGETEGTEEEIWEKGKAKLAKLTSNWLVNKLLGIAAKEGRTIFNDDSNINPENFAEFITIVYQNKINSTLAQKLLEIMYQTGQDPSVIMTEEDLTSHQTGQAVEEIIDQVIKNSPDQVKQFQNGKETIVQYFIGQVMSATKGQANPQEIKAVLINKLKKL
ncbi:MAG: glutaminyl-tRNA synthase (glutamine-hydrolyzing) subunit B [Candidatus Buchananbacteria bacterium RIFCSPHIGHO2_01_FULL_44_11]|uniref:Aspartyl/glutamyl-tRNA(Asn/Gln) amidotransferase subunit B n=1 Tax=Candidatus Buchananbacteria bacterium RIFCSPHIGHO2_01_FULL_44_11 TaxID=1797535 RepID=A0A1G1Y1F3_9BACT|nr:MAG: glutaminyl-tRNA synthase (glutamine-hydrolyzing) subunit B [Candidatus Buchananbacteria bacterium RIFCSPHIGHO2_01_FULL_44_11]